MVAHMIRETKSVLSLAREIMSGARFPSRQEFVFSLWSTHSLASNRCQISLSGMKAVKVSLHPVPSLEFMEFYFHALYSISSHYDIEATLSFICLFNDALSNWQCRVSKNSINNEWWILRNVEGSRNVLKVIYRNVYVGAEKKNPWTILLTIADLWVEIWTNDLPNAKRERSNFAVIDTSSLKNTASHVHNTVWMKIIRKVRT
jgi:hypothetical protein